MGNPEKLNDSDEIAKQTHIKQAGNTLFLKPKGACWYCNTPLDNIRRFCNKTCADDYRFEEDAISRLI